MDARERWAKVLSDLEAADRALMAALDARARAVNAAAEVRRLEPQSYFQLPAKEAVVARAHEHRGAFPERSIEPVMREVLSACTALVSATQIAVVASDGAFGEEAAHAIFGHAVSTQPVASVDAAVLAVERGEVTYALVALETSSEGATSATLFALANGTGKIIREKTIRSATDADKQTRFLVVGREGSRRTGADRTFIALSLSEDPGSLYAALQPFAERGINLTRLESRQAPGSRFDRLFFVELDGHTSDRAVLTAIDEVRAKSRHLRVIGSYPRPSND
jgi:prephenate dehydratase/chorismate mutase